MNSSKQEAIKRAATKVCIELAFVIPRGTRMLDHPLAKAILELVKATKEAKDG